jgi:PAS domain S-box-containing protein
MTGEGLLLLTDTLEVVEANDAAAALLGYSPRELIGRPIQDILVSSYDVLSSLLDVLGHDCPAEIPRLAVHRRDGTPVPIHLRALPFSADPARRMLLSFADQSERQAIEDQQELLTQRALLGEVSAIFAHEVRNPINNISTGVQLVASRLGKDSPLYETLDRVKKECSRLDQLMTDVLFFARPLELKIEPTDVRAFIERILARWAPRFAQGKVTLNTSFAPDLPAALLDPRTFEQVVVNLISNALQAMPDGGGLSIGVAPGSEARGRTVEIKVADTGPGIPQAVLDRIFDPFFTTKKTGTGLGLAISRRILAAHKGRIQVESYPDAGTLFTIHLPAA